MAQAWQLMVDGKPFLIRGGEFSNNVFESPKDLPYLEAMLKACREYDSNTVLVPISWRSLAAQLTIGHLNVDVSAMRLPVSCDARAAVMISSTCSACSGVTSNSRPVTRHSAANAAPCCQM
jgi:hypothetical protein